MDSLVRNCLSFWFGCVKFLEVCSAPMTTGFLGIHTVLNCQVNIAYGEYPIPLRALVESVFSKSGPECCVARYESKTGTGVVSQAKCEAR